MIVRALTTSVGAFFFVVVAEHMCDTLLGVGQYYEDSGMRFRDGEMSLRSRSYAL